MDKNEFALRLSQLRERKGVSARDMSLSIGQNPGYIYNIESGKSNPSLTGLLYICEYLEITPSEFFDTENREPNKLTEIVQDLKSLDSRRLELVSEIVKELKNK